ncbi:CPBP family intramembrane metalloprotease [bacterium]|nr:CPBP family intramembrane metalloprotease [bacterium]
MFDDEDDFDFEDPHGPEMTARERAEGFIRTAVLFESGLAVVAVILGAVVGIPAWHSASYATGHVLPVLGAIGLGVLGTIPLVIIFFWMQRATFLGLDDLQDFMETKVVPLFREATVIELGMISIAAGLGEEALFRGVVQAYLQKLVGTGAGPVVPIMISSILFGLVHYMTEEYLVISALMGAYLGVWFYCTGDIIVPIVIHALYDWFAMVYWKKATPAAVETEE